MDFARIQVDLYAPAKLSRDPDKAAGAAKDFEAVLVGQFLQSARQGGSGWLGGGDDTAGDTAVSLGEQQLAQSIAKVGGIGISKIIEGGLRASAITPPTPTRQN
jgi:Rod binding domain-containing protein